jgi:hypothetical protein
MRPLPELPGVRHALFGRGERPQSAGQLQGVERRVPRIEIELVDDGHRLLDQRSRLLADRARTWFA